MRRRIIAAAVAVTLALAACTPSDGQAGQAEAAEAPITVFAAASLTQVFTEMGEDYTSESGVPVQFNFAGSADLMAQLTGGAPADVLATADEATMTKAVDAQLIEGDQTFFATNTLMIAVQPGNPLRVTGLADLADPAKAVVVCAPQVPCGTATGRVLQAASVTLAPVSEENSVTDVLGKVTSGEADAGLVYATDVTRSAGGTEAVDFPEAADVVNRYPAARVAHSTQPEAAQEFISWLAGPEARAALAEAGFGAP